MVSQELNLNDQLDISEDEIKKQVEQLEEQINSPILHFSFIQKMQYLTLFCAPSTSFCREAICRVSNKVCNDKN